MRLCQSLPLITFTQEASFEHFGSNPKHCDYILKHFWAFLRWPIFWSKMAKKTKKLQGVHQGFWRVFWLQKIEKCHLNVKFNQELRQTIGEWWESTWVHYFAHSLVISKRNLTREAKKWQKWAFFSLFTPKGRFFQKKKSRRYLTSNPKINTVSQFGTKNWAYLRSTLQFCGFPAVFKGPILKIDGFWPFCQKGGPQASYLEYTVRVLLKTLDTHQK